MDQGVERRPGRSTTREQQKDRSDDSFPNCRGVDLRGGAPAGERENKVRAGSPIAWPMRRCVGLKQRLIRDGSFGCDWADTLFRFYTRRIPNDGVAAPLASRNHALPAQKEESARLARGPPLDKVAHGSEG